jgi:hypothetical protein
MKTLSQKKKKKGSPVHTQPNLFNVPLLKKYLPSLKLSGTLATKRHKNQAPFLTCSKASATSTIGSREGSSIRKKKVNVTIRE